MAGSVNKATILGNVGKDPEIRTTQSGGKIASLTIATSESWKDRNSGERKERTEWHRVAIMSAPLAEVVEKYVKKGSKLYLEGQLQTRKWTDQSGQDRYTTEIVISGFGGQLVMLDGRSSDGGSSAPAPQPQPRPQPKPQQQPQQHPEQQPEPAYDDTDIPF